MCHRTTCKTCKKPTWAGCGMHVEQALAGVPKSERCQCERVSVFEKIRRMFSGS